MSGHTPGPWLYRPKNEGVYTAPPEGANYSYGELIFAFNEDFTPPSFDLPLILSAPELLEALRYARRFLRPEDHDTAFVDAAIAKAKGEPHA